ncbi:MAG: hypothetical protein ACRDT6_19280 [Micromonosporaceae bacterium]
MATLHEYRVVHGPGDTVSLRTTVDLRGRTLTVELPGGTRTTLDVITARALYLTLGQAVYESLEPDGPWLRLQRNTGTGWTGDEWRYA